MRYWFWRLQWNCRNWLFCWLGDSDDSGDWSKSGDSGEFGDSGEYYDFDDSCEFGDSVENGDFELIKFICGHLVNLSLMMTTMMVTIMMMMAMVMMMPPWYDAEPLESSGGPGAMQGPSSDVQCVSWDNCFFEFCPSILAVTVSAKILIRNSPILLPTYMKT